jgi:hypothetical protein
MPKGAHAGREKIKVSRAFGRMYIQDIITEAPLRTGALRMSDGSMASVQTSSRWESV